MPTNADCPNCRRLQAELGARIASLERTVARLQQELDVEHRAGKRQAAPFSKGEPKKNPKPPGRKPGDAYGQHVRRPLPDRVDETHEVPLPESCPHCHGALREESVQDQFQEDLPPVQTIIRRFRVHVGHCLRCGRRVQGRHPLQTSDALGAAGVQVGPRALATSAQMNKELGLPYGKAALFFQTAFGLTAARATLCRANLRLAHQARPTYDALLLGLRRTAAVYGDETGWKIAGQTAWLWAFATRRFTVYLIRRSRGQDVVAEALGVQFAGLLGRDGWCAWRMLACRAQSCLAHLLKRCRELHAQSLAGQARFPLAVKCILQNALALRDRRNRISPHGFAIARGRLEAGMDRLLEGRYTHEPNARFARHLARERPALFTFLHHPGLEATNWPAEQAIRPAVVNRKTSGGSRSERGAEAQAVLTTLIRTARQQLRDPIKLLVRLLQTPAPLDLSLATPPAPPRPNPHYLLPLPRAQPA